MELQRIKGDDPTPPGYFEIRLMDRTGDTKIIWDPTKQAEVDTAKESFDRLVKKERYLAFAVNDKGDKGEQLREFDPRAGKLILVPPMVGG